MAAARLFAHSAKAPAQKPVAPPAAAETSPEQSAPTTEIAAAEAQPASAEAETTVPTPPEESAEAPAPEEPADDVLSPATLDETLKAKVQNRINKEIGMRKAAEAQATALQNRIKELESKVSTTTSTTPPAATQTTNPGTNLPLAVPNQPLANINDKASLDQFKQSAKQAVRWAEDTLDNPKAWKVQTDIDPQTGEEKSKRVLTVGKDTFDEDQVRAYRRENKIVLEDQVPAREEFLQVRARANKDAREAYGFLSDQTAPEYQQAQSMLRDPWVQMRPDAEWIVATQIMGLKALETTRAAAKTKAAEPVKPKPAAAKPGSDQSAISQSAAPSRMSPEAGQRLANSKARQDLAAKGAITAAEAAAFLERTATTRKSG